MDSIIPSSCSLPLPLPCPRAILFGAQAKIHLTLLLFFVIVSSVSLQFIHTFPLYTVLVVVLCGPILLASVLLHESGHLWMSRRILGCNRHHPVILWPFGGYTYCDGLSTATQEEAMMRGHLMDDIKIAFMGPVMHSLGAAFWFAMYLAINDGDFSGFTFRKYLTVMSSGYQGFFSTLFQQSCLLNILLMWVNLFVPIYPLDGGRLMTASLLLIGVALNKAALLTLVISIFVSLALFAWSIASFFDGVGMTGLLAVLIAIHAWAECYRLYSSIIGGRLREHPLFGRDCYIYRDARPSLFQMSSAARHVASGIDSREEEVDRESVNMTMVPTETDVDRDTHVTDID